MISALQDFIAGHEALLGWLGLLSLLMFVGTAVVIPWILVRLPTDYFACRERRSWLRREGSLLVYVPLRVLKNLVGVGLVLLGILLLVLPGQGVLTIVIGVVLLDFPSKYRLEGWLVRRPGVRNSINWLRRKHGKEPLRFE